MPEESRATNTLLRSASTWAERAIGVAALLVAIVMGTAVWALGRAITVKPESQSTGSWVALSIASTAGVFLLVAGVRLVFQLPNKFGSIHAPWVWFALCVAFLLMGVSLMFPILRAPSFEGARGLVSTLLLALFSYGAGAHFSRKAREASGSG